jgi:hypothetical protein
MENLEIATAPTISSIWLLANKCPTEVVAVVPSTVYRKVLSVSTVI